MLRLRVISAAVLITGFAGLLYLDAQFPWASDWFRSDGAEPMRAGGIWLLPLILLATGLASLELVDLLDQTVLKPHRWLAHAGSLLTVGLAAVPIFWKLSGTPYPPNCPIGHLGWPMIGIAITIAAALTVEVIAYRSDQGTLLRLAGTTWAVVYLGGLASFLVALRDIEPMDNHRGLVAVFSTVLIVKFSDIGAYTFGRLLGRHKMTPRLSPGKTVEGAIGGVVAGCLASLALFVWAVPRIFGGSATAVWAALVYGVVLVVAGVLGDLAESAVKRDANRKDSGSRVPGFGGMLDVIDSLLLAAPAAYACWLAELV